MIADTLAGVCGQIPLTVRPAACSVAVVSPEVGAVATRATVVVAACVWAALAYKVANWRVIHR